MNYKSEIVKVLRAIFPEIDMNGAESKGNGVI